MTQDDGQAWEAMRSLRIGDDFTYRGRRYTLASYTITSTDTYFTARVFAPGGGTRDVRIRWQGTVLTEV